MLAWSLWNNHRCPRGHHLDGQDEIQDHAIADLYKCELCAEEQNRMTARTKQGAKGGNTAGLFIRWFPRAAPIVKRYLGGAEVVDDG